MDIFPKHFDNAYRGQWLAVPLLAVIAVARLAGGASMLGGNPWASPRFMLQRGDGIALDSFDPAVADILVFFFSMTGTSFVLLGILALIALVRYRSMIPLVFLLFIADEITLKALSSLHPIVHSTAQIQVSNALSLAKVINYSIIAVLITGFLLSVWRRRSA